MVLWSLGLVGIARLFEAIRVVEEVRMFKEVRVVEEVRMVKDRVEYPNH